MKTITKAIAVLSVTAALNTQAQTCCYTDSLSSTAGWTFNGSTESISGGTFNFSNTPDEAYNYATHTLNCTLSDKWKADVDFKYTGRGTGGTGHTILATTAGTQDAWNTGVGFSASNQDGMIMYINCPINGAQSTDSIYGNSKKGTTYGTVSRGIHIAENTQYYLRMEMLSPTQGQISVFSNAARTTHIAGSPVQFSWAAASRPSGLDVVQIGNIPQGYMTRALTATEDNIKICDVAPPTCCDTNNYSSSTGWVFNGTDLSISGGTFNFNATQDDAYNYATDSLPCYLSDSSWVSNIDFIYTGRGTDGVGHNILGVQAGTQDTWNTGVSYGISNQNCLDMWITCPYGGAQSTDSIYGGAKAGTTWGATSKGIHVALSTQYYLRMERLSYTQGRISVFTNAARTTHATGSPQTFTIPSGVTGLHVIEHGCMPQGYFTRTMTAALDNFTICGNAEPFRLADPTTMGITTTKANDLINIYPNPNNGTFTIETAGNEKQMAVMVYDINGKLVLSQTIVGKTIINTGNLSSGIYNLSLISNGVVTNKRLIIEK
ncbi:MAG TPA: T9SS type A sorting domain-containing protein [Bacteroidia bacterium]|nr:T9SS type A sorting domain-containing protein [Bacteroidia bacterium]